MGREVCGVLILTVTPNLALDITYEVPRLIPGATHRVRRVRPMAASLVHTPEMSGSPHAVFGTANAFAGAAVFCA